MKNIFDKRLSDLLKEKGLSKRELGKLTEISAQSISDWSTGKVQPTAENIYILATFFNVSTDYLLGLEDDFGSKAEKNAVKKIVSDDLSGEEIEMIKKIRLLGPYEQTYIKAQIDALSDTIKSKQKEKSNL